ncbi:hypothetical protein K3175_09085 [Qipengyuania sp. GH1]|uniref:hypothetical protein n=1 Tax=Qipengyuania aestuarii TaxID=2867241 RepID=UPI001C88977C|nr:hypothetical protein [Qipengyuania aestuarii]MBX7535816.1 hypothetical protein [Qipengyuania aestuarii]
MKKNILLVASGSFMALHGASAVAQQAPQHAEHGNLDAAPTAPDKAALMPQQDNRGVDFIPRPDPEQDAGVDELEPAEEQRVTEPAMDHSHHEDEGTKTAEKKSDPL